MSPCLSAYRIREISLVKLAVDALEKPLWIFLVCFYCWLWTCIFHWLQVLFSLFASFMDITRSGSRTATTSKMEHFVIIVNGWKPLNIITKSSILDVAAALYPPLNICTASVSFHKTALLNGQSINGPLIIWNHWEFWCTFPMNIKWSFVKV